VLWRNEQTKRRASLVAQGWFLLGVAVGVLPNLVFLVINPENYLFNNIGYHSIRTAVGLVGVPAQKLLTGLELMGVWNAGGRIGLQFPILLFANCYYLLLAYQFGKRLSLPCYTAIILSAVSMLPTPTFVQYFCVVVPFLVINGILVVHWLDEAATGSAIRNSLKLLLALIVAIYVLTSPISVDQFLFPAPANDILTGEAGAQNWQIDTVNKVASQINECTQPGEPIISWWPGYFLQTHASIFPKMENHFGLGVANRLSQSQLDRYRIISEQEIRQHIKKGSTRVVVLGNWVTWRSKAQYRELLAESGYVLTRKVADTEIYLRLR